MYFSFFFRTPGISSRLTLFSISMIEMCRKHAGNMKSNTIWNKLVFYLELNCFSTLIFHHPIHCYSHVYTLSIQTFVLIVLPYRNGDSRISLLCSILYANNDKAVFPSEYFPSEYYIAR